MEEYAVQTPVLMIVFNRPDKAERLLHSLRKVKAKKLYVFADGPRSNRPEDLESCEATRAVFDQIDWECEVKTLFQEENLGCGLGPSTGITWLFENESQGIILEDDCMANISFFAFCDELLAYYEDDTRIMQISGSNFHRGWKRDPEYSYYFSDMATCWGWATWARAWKHFEFYVPKVSEMVDKGYTDQFWLKDKIDFFAYHPNIEKEHWDYQWDFCKFINSGLSIVPNVNTVLNIGLEDDGTHSFEKEKYYFDNKELIKFPLKHPPFVIKDIVSDQRYYKNYWYRSPAYKMKMKVKESLPPWIWSAGKKAFGRN